MPRCQTVKDYLPFCVYFPPMSVDCLSLMRVTSSLCWVNHFKTVSIKLFICHLLSEQSSIKPHIYRFYVHKLSLVWLLPMIYFHTLGLVQYSSQELAFSLIKRQRYIVKNILQLLKCYFCLGYFTYSFFVISSIFFCQGTQIHEDYLLENCYIYFGVALWKCLHLLWDVALCNTMFLGDYNYFFISAIRRPLCLTFFWNYI